MKRAVVSFANGQYLSKLDRLKDSFKGRTNADLITFTDFAQINCKPHSVVPYLFKPYAIQKAIDLGYETVLWCDSPVVAVKDVGPVFDYIEENGYMFFDNIGHPLGMWANDKSLNHFKVSREEAMTIRQIMACVMGFDFTNPMVKSIFTKYKELEYLYPGSWTDHRHDQTVMSLLIHQFGLDILTAHETFFIYEQFKNVKEFKIADSVCLVSK